MKKTVAVIVLVLIAAAGCSRQSQEPKGQAAYPAPVMKSPEEIKLLEQMAKQEPKNSAGWTALGNALMDSNRYTEAVDAYRKSLDLDPSNVAVRVDMGTCLKNSGRPKEAVEEYRKAIKINPNHVNAHRNLGVVLAFELRDNKGAVKEFEKYLELAPNAPDAGDIRRAVAQLQAAK